MTSSRARGTEQRPHDLRLVQAQVDAADDGAERVRLETDRGVIECRMHDGSDGDLAVLWVFGAGGGLGGPAGGMYERLGRALPDDGIASLQVAYRTPGHLLECVLDVLLAIEWLRTRERRRVVLVGHSFGGAVVITSAAVSDAVV